MVRILQGDKRGLKFGVGVESVVLTLLRIFENSAVH